MPGTQKPTLRYLRRASRRDGKYIERWSEKREPAATQHHRFDKLSSALRSKIYALVAVSDLSIFVHHSPAQFSKDNPNNAMDAHITFKSNMRLLNKLYRAEHLSALASEIGRSPALDKMTFHVFDHGFTFPIHCLTSLSNADVAVRNQLCVVIPAVSKRPRSRAIFTAHRFANP